MTATEIFLYLKVTGLMGFKVLDTYSIELIASNIFPLFCSTDLSPDYVDEGLGSRTAKITELWRRESLSQAPQHRGEVLPLQGGPATTPRERTGQGGRPGPSAAPQPEETPAGRGHRRPRTDQVAAQLGSPERSWVLRGELSPLPSPQHRRGTPTRRRRL